MHDEILEIKQLLKKLTTAQSVSDDKGPVITGVIMSMESSTIGTETEFIDNQQVHMTITSDLVELSKQLINKIEILKSINT